MNMKMNTNGALSCGVGKIVLVELSISDKLLMLCLCYFFRGSVVSGEFPVGCGVTRGVALGRDRWCDDKLVGFLVEVARRLSVILSK